MRYLTHASYCSFRQLSPFCNDPIDYRILLSHTVKKTMYTKHSLVTAVISEVYVRFVTLSALGDHGFYGRGTPEHTEMWGSVQAEEARANCRWAI